MVLTKLIPLLLLSITDDLAASPPALAQLHTSNGLFIAIATQQDEVEITGSIKDISSHKSVAGAVIAFSGTSFSTFSKADGSFQLLVPEEPLKSGFFKLTIAAPG